MPQRIEFLITAGYDFDPVEETLIQKEYLTLQSKRKVLGERISEWFRDVPADRSSSLIGVAADMLDYNRQVGKLFSESVSEFVKRPTGKKKITDGAIVSMAVMFYKFSAGKKSSDILKSLLGKSKGGISKKQEEVLRKFENLALIDTASFAVDIGGYSIRKLVESEEPDPISEFKFFMSAIEAYYGVHDETKDEKGIMMKDKIIKKLMDENKEYPKSDYPTLIKSGLMFTVPTLTWIIMGGIDEKRINESFANRSHQVQRAVKPFKQFIERVRTSQDGISQMLLNPDDSREHKNFREAFTSFTQQDNRLLDALLLSKIVGSHKTLENYRRLQELSEGDVAPDFYNELTERTMSLIKKKLGAEKSNKRWVLDSDVLLREDIYPSHANINWDRLLNTLKEISSLTSVRSYVLKPDEVQESFFKTDPKLITLEIDKNHPTWRFKIALEWEVEGSSTNMDILYDLKQRTFDWTILDDPNVGNLSEELLRFKAASVAVSYEVLQHVLDQAKKAKIPKQVSPSQSPNGKNPKRERFEDPVYKLRKEVKKGSHKAPSGLAAVVKELKQKKS